MTPVLPHQRTAKRIELAFRGLFNKLFRSGGEPKVITSPEQGLMLGEQPRILFLRQDRIGDVLITTPVVKAVRERFPNARIDVVLSRNNIGVVQTIAPYIGMHYVYQKTLWSLITLIKTIRSEHYDVVVDLLDNASSTSSVLVAGSGAVHTVGIDKENRGVYTAVVPLRSKAEVHISDRVSQLVMAFGIDPATIDMRPVYTFEEHDVAQARAELPGIEQAEFPFGIIYSGSSEFRKYDEAKVVEVLKTIMPRYPRVSVYLFGAPHHAGDIARIASATGAHAVAPSSSFHRYACALHEMKAIMSPDTSGVHLAAAWNTPTCVLFNQPDPNQLPWYPYHTHCEAVINRGENLSDLPVGDVVGAIERLFAYCTFPMENHELP